VHPQTRRSARRGACSSSMTARQSSVVGAQSPPMYVSLQSPPLSPRPGAGRCSRGPSRPLLRSNRGAHSMCVRRRGSTSPSETVWDELAASQAKYSPFTSASCGAHPRSESSGSTSMKRLPTFGTGTQANCLGRGAATGPRGEGGGHTLFQGGVPPAKVQAPRRSTDEAQRSCVEAEVVGRRRGRESEPRLERFVLGGQRQLHCRRHPRRPEPDRSGAELPADRLEQVADRAGVAVGHVRDAPRARPCARA
jgi:hypothetical protein